MSGCLTPFATRLYQRPGVAEACLRLQDRRGLDVPLLLAAAWQGRRDRRLTMAEWRELAADLGPWRQQVVEPLRGVRRTLRAAAATEPAVAELREQVRAAELAAEYRTLAELERRLLPRGRAASGAVVANLVAVAGEWGADLSRLRGAAELVSPGQD